MSPYTVEVWGLLRFLAFLHAFSCFFLQHICNFHITRLCTFIHHKETNILGYSSWEKISLKQIFLDIVAEKKCLSCILHTTLYHLQQFRALLLSFNYNAFWWKCNLINVTGPPGALLFNVKPEIARKESLELQF